MSSVIPRPWRSKLRIGHAVIGNLSNDPRSRAMVGIRPDKATRRAGTFLNQRRAGNEVILKECIQYSVPIPRPSLRILASHSIGAVQVRESGCLAVCTTVRPINLGKHLNPSRPTFGFGQSSGANGLQEHRHDGSCYGTVPGLRHKKEHQKSRKVSCGHTHVDERDMDFETAAFNTGVLHLQV